MMKKIIIFSLVIGTILCVVSYGIKPSAVFKKPIISAKANDNRAHETLSTWGTKENVETFLTILERAQYKDLGKEKDFVSADWYNVTPQEVLEKTGGQIFKSSSTYASFLLYEGEIYLLGNFFGGLGVMDIKVCDFDQDGEYELLYTYSWGSGQHRSHVGHLDLKTRKETQLDFVHLNKDMVIVENLDGTFSLYEAQVECGERNFVDFSLTPRMHLADLVYKEGELQVLETIAFSLDANGNYKGFSNLPKHYTAWKAEKDGCFVTQDSEMTPTNEVWDNFIATAAGGKNTALRMVNFHTDRTDGPYYTDLFFNEGYYYRFDSSAESQEKQPFSYLLTLEGRFGMPMRDCGVIVLTDDNTLTFHDVMKSMLSSNMEYKESISPYKIIMFL